MVDNIQKDLKQAQLARDEVKVSTLRLLLSEIRNEEISKGGELSDNEVVTIIQREAKKRKEAAAGFRQGEREASALKEEAELKVLEGYLPAQLSNEELTKLVEDSITELEAKGLINEVGAKGIQDMGRVMSVVMSKVAGRSEGSVVSRIVKSKLLG